MHSLKPAGEAASVHTQPTLPSQSPHPAPQLPALRPPWSLHSAVPSSQNALPPLSACQTSIGSGRPHSNPIPSGRFSQIPSPCTTLSRSQTLHCCLFYFEGFGSAGKDERASSHHRDSPFANVVPLLPALFLVVSRLGPYRKPALFLTRRKSRINAVLFSKVSFLFEFPLLPHSHPSELGLWSGFALGLRIHQDPALRFLAASPSTSFIQTHYSTFSFPCFEDSGLFCRRSLRLDLSAYFLRVAFRVSTPPPRRPFLSWLHFPGAPWEPAPPYDCPCSFLVSEVAPGK